MYVLLSDPSGTGVATASLMATVTHWITAYGVPMLVGIMAVGFSVMLLIKFAKRAVASADGGGYSYLEEEWSPSFDMDESSFDDSFWDTHWLSFDEFGRGMWGDL